MHFDDKESRKLELDNCVFCKTILMLLVVLGHSVVFWRGDWYGASPIYQARFLPVLSKWVGGFHTYAFTVFSGYIFYYMKYEKGSYRKLNIFLVKKVKRLLVPYVFILCVWIIPIMKYYLKFTLKDILGQFITGIAPSQLWFLLMLFWVSLFSYLLSDILLNTKWRMVIIAIFYGWGVFGSHICPNFWQIWTACRYMLYFWIGMELRCKYSKSVKKIPGIIWIWGYTCLVVVSQNLSDVSSFIGKCCYELLMLGSHVIGVLMAYCILQKIADQISWEENKWFMLLSRYSMPIYLFHQQIIYFLIDDFNGMINPYIHALINFLGAIIISFLISFLLMNFKITKFLLGEK